MPSFVVNKFVSKQNELIRFELLQSVCLRALALRRSL